VTGTLSINGSHLHICLSNSIGQTIGGHMADGNIIFTTAEIIIAAAANTVFERVPDIQTGFRELSIISAN
jgi:predicted DNA-binding protein with PD1-like motif